MNKTIKLAVAGAVLSAASVANAGIIIPAGEWTLDVNGNVNSFAIIDNRDNTAAIIGGLATTEGTTKVSDRASMNTGLLPSWLGFTGTTRQNDLDVSFTISMQPGTSTNSALVGGGTTENRQAFITFGDKSWGSVKVGKDLGIFGSDAILSDMTLLGVGSTGASKGNGTTTTLGHIGTGYVYADWTGQIAYTTPNMNGFQATVGIMQAWKAGSLGIVNNTSATSLSADSETFGFQAKASYALPMGKVWVGYMQQDLDNVGGSGQYDAEADAQEIGATVNLGNATLTAYYYTGEGLGSTGMFVNGVDAVGKERDSDGAFVQATYIVPTGTKLGVSYGRSDLDATANDGAAKALVTRNELWTVGAYHPLTKHLNLVAEYNDSTSESMTSSAADNESDSFSVGAILFF